jgi:hypothetical protein
LAIFAADLIKYEKAAHSAAMAAPENRDRMPGRTV